MRNFYWFIYILQLSFGKIYSIIFLLGIFQILDIKDDVKLYFIHDRFCFALFRLLQGLKNHYFMNKGFFPSDSFLLDNVDKIRHINTIIVQVYVYLTLINPFMVDMLSPLFFHTFDMDVYLDR